VLGGIGQERVDLMGLSYGGFLSFRFALDVPNRIRRLVVPSRSPRRHGALPAPRPGGEAEMLEGAGYIVSMDRPDEVSFRILKHLDPPAAN